MDNIIYASVRQVASTWYYIALTQDRSHDDAVGVGIMQAELYLSDLGLMDAAAGPYLEGARKAIASVMQGKRQN